MVQLWVNLPKEKKMTEPKYQSITKEMIPTVVFNDKTQIKIIAGSLSSKKGPASTFSPINIYDINSLSEDTLELSFDEASSTMMLVREGEIELENKIFTKSTLIIFDQKGKSIKLKTTKNFKAFY